MTPEVIDILATLIVTVAGLLIKKWVDTKTTPAQLQMLTELTRTAVEAAEEVGDALGLQGPEKYEYASTALTTAAKRVGLRIKPEEANAFIHAVLRESKTYLALKNVEEASST